VTFSYDLDTPVGQIRLEIGDTDDTTGAGIKPTGANFSDEELTYFYTSESSSVQRAAARACEVLARMWAGAAESVRIRDYAIDTTRKAEYYADLAKELRAKAGGAYAGGSAPTVKVDGYSDDIDSQETEAGGGEYWRKRKVIRWP
jgi:hypothetical protein